MARCRRWTSIVGVNNRGDLVGFGGQQPFQTEELFLLVRDDNGGGRGARTVRAGCPRGTRRPPCCCGAGSSARGGVGRLSAGTAQGSSAPVSPLVRITGSAPATGAEFRLHCRGHGGGYGTRHGEASALPVCCLECRPGGRRNVATRKGRPITSTAPGC